jgi:hypothetical protein
MPFAEPDGLLTDQPTIYRMRDLRYFLIEGQTSWLKGLRIIDSRRRNWEDREVILYVLGTSHALTLRHEERQITELLSCRGRFGSDQCLAEMAAGDPFEVSTAVHGLRYQFRLTLHDLSGDNVLLDVYPREDEMCVSYPQQAEFATPVTRIGWRIEPGVLRLQTLHTYPEEASEIRTESVIEVQK